MIISDRNALSGSSASPVLTRMTATAPRGSGRNDGTTACAGVYDAGFMFYTRTCPQGFIVLTFSWCYNIGMRTKAFRAASTLLFLLASSCVLTQSGGIYASNAVDPGEITGEYNVVLYGNRYGDDVETVAVLDAAGDAYTFEPLAPDYDYKVRKAVKSDVAVSDALRFISGHTAYRTARIRRIALDGDTIGYEVKPLYHLHQYGQADITHVRYFLKGKSVIMDVRLKRAVERILHRKESSK